MPFELYPFQEEAILAWFECDGGVLVTAPTGMGKTLIAETAVFEALKSGQRIYYTTPLIALTNAISGIVIVGALLVTGLEAAGTAAEIMGFIAVLLASINVFGGFLVTHRMLSMFKKKQK